MSHHNFMEETYALKGNPFLDDVAREEWLETWVNREEQLKEWKKVISNAVNTTKNYIAFIIGSYGRGKTLSLLKIIDEAKKQSEIFPIYITFMGEQKPRNPGLDFIFRIFKSINFDILSANKKETELKNAIENLPDSLRDAKSILNKIYFGEDAKDLALYFLKGEVKPNQTQLKKLEVIRKIDDIDIAKEYLAGILVFIKTLGFSTVLIVVDEFEYLFSLVSRAQHGIYLALLRGLYDFPVGFSQKLDSIANMAFFIAISEDGMRNLQDMEKRERSSGGPIQPLLDRIDAETSLNVFDKKQTRQLIENRLKFNRIEGKYEDQALIPFKEDFVDFLYDKTSGEPRAIITRCGQVLDAGLEKGAKLLDKNFALKALQERGLV